jgi:vacuolar-type H+-ATPase subunit I/STV1
MATAAKSVPRKKAGTRKHASSNERRPAPSRVHTRSKPMADPKKPAADGADRNVDQIRDILFGGQMRDYERRFQELNQRLEADLARLRDTQEKRLAQIDKRIDDQLEKLGKLVRQEVQDRNSAVDDLESRLQQAARTARVEINKSLEGLSHELTGSDERLRGALVDLHTTAAARATDTESALARTSAELRAEKVGRDDLAALLTEFALRLKGDFDLPLPNK